MVLLYVAVVILRKMRRTENKAAIDTSANMRAFLWMIRVGEGTANARGYNTLYGGGQFTDLSKHPNKAITAGNYTSTAAGAYQFLYKTWKEVSAKLGLTDFSPQSQDIAAVEKIRERGAYDLVIAGKLQEAIAKCAKEWASLPGSPYGQPTRTLAQATTSYKSAGGTLA